MAALSAKRKLQLSKVGIIVLCWLVLGTIFGLSDHLVVNSLISEGPALSYTLSKGMITNLIAALMGSVMGGFVLVFSINEEYRDKPYWKGVVSVFFAFIVITSMITLLLGFIIAPMETNEPFLSIVTISHFKNYITDPIHIKNLILWGVVVAITQLLLQMNDKFGPGLLWDFIRGRYHSPKQETRIFMFVDLRSSTTIAESLGNERYYGLLRDFYADITDAIIYNKGEIYQYVGDEIVISWKLDQGVANNHCIKCYFDMRKRIGGLSKKYNERYGLVPDFKAGMHYGRVTAGEIGIIKRDITFSGDVLNTTARIQSECNSHEVNFLASDQLLDLLSLQQYRSQSIGSILLRGKEQSVELSTVEPVYN